MTDPNWNWGITDQPILDKLEYITSDDSWVKRGFFQSQTAFR